MKLTYLTHCKDCNVTEENHKHKLEVMARIFANKYKNKQAWRKYPKFIKELDK